MIFSVKSPKQLGVISMSGAKFITKKERLGVWTMRNQNHVAGKLKKCWSNWRKLWLLSLIALVPRGNLFDFCLCWTFHSSYHPQLRLCSFCISFIHVMEKICIFMIVKGSSEDNERQSTEVPWVKTGMESRKKLSDEPRLNPEPEFESASL